MSAVSSRSVSVVECVVIRAIPELTSKLEMPISFHDSCDRQTTHPAKRGYP